MLPETGANAPVSNYTGAFAPVDAPIASLYHFGVFDFDLPGLAVGDHALEIFTLAGIGACDAFIRIGVLSGTNIY